MPSQPSPFDQLLGQWRLTRDIPGQASAHGHATVRRLTPDQARYDEHVTLRLLSGSTLQASAAYLFHQQPPGDPHSLAVLFPHTGQLFHLLHFAPDLTGTLAASATHCCAADTYHSTYRIHSSNHITIEHRAQGPTKNYITRTTLIRP